MRSGPDAVNDLTTMRQAQEVMRAWNEVDDSSKSKEALDAIAAANEYKSGKWMYFCSPASVDHIWTSIAQEVVSGRLGPSAKVSTRDPSHPTHVICVYTGDFTDQLDLQRVRAGLTDACGLKSALNYKTDAATTVGIYAKNPWGISPCHYRA